MYNYNDVNNELRIKLESLPIYRWESGIISDNPDVRSFVDNHSEFYVVKNNNKLYFYSLDCHLKLISSEIKEMIKSDSYIRVQTNNTIYHILRTSMHKTSLPVYAIKETADTKEGNNIPKYAHIKDIKELAIELLKEYYYTSHRNHKFIFDTALGSNLITEEQYNSAKEFYIAIWDFELDDIKSEVFDNIEETVDIKAQNSTPKYAHIKDIDKLNNLLYTEYPYASYGSFASMYNDALIDGYITEEQHLTAYKKYQYIWNYAGD